MVGNARKKTFTSVGGLPRFQRWVLPTKVGRFVSFRRLCCEVKGGEDKSSSNFKVRFPVVEPVANVYPVMLPMSFKDLEATPFSYQGLLYFNLNPKGFNRSVSWNKVFNRSVSWNKVGVGNRSLILNYRSCYIPFIAAIIPTLLRSFKFCTYEFTVYIYIYSIYMFRDQFAF